MSKSQKRGGEKEHRKKVNARNQFMKGYIQRQVKITYEKHEEWKKQKELDANKSSNNESIPRLNFTEQKD
jgi:hypothetical protein